jgi:predicted 3-demethylubiquinone-9 3-methyltransferase (glyoxalase superfamily)
MAPDKPGTIAHSSFTLEGEEFIAMDSAREHTFSFNEGVSLMVYCDDQAEIDYYWGKLSAIPEAEQCGWLKDKYGVSWQITPRAIDDLIQKSDRDEQGRIMQAILAMKKLDWATIEKAVA